jgi:hypothetical protein
MSLWNSWTLEWKSDTKIIIYFGNLMKTPLEKFDGNTLVIGQIGVVIENVHWVWGVRP